MISQCIEKIKTDSKGWTFAETLIVIAIVMILSATVSIMGLRFIDKARVMSAKSQISVYTAAVYTYILDNKTAPTQEQGLEALFSKPHLHPVPESWNGPYINKTVSTDPWGNAFLYESPGPHGLPFAISSLGANGRKGGQGNDAEIYSWQD